MSLSDNEADALFEDIVISFQRGERKKAIALAATALEKGLDEPLVLLLAAEGLEEEGRYAEGIVLLQKAAEIAPEEAQVWFCLGTMLIRQGRDEDGLADLRTALSLQSDLLPALSNAAAASYRLGQLTEAITYYRRIKILEPNNVDALAALAAIAARRHKSEEARKMASQALALQADNFTAQMAIGRADLVDKKTQNARSRMDKLIESNKLNDDERVASLDLRAEALDILDCTGAAFADYESRNGILMRRFAPRMKREVTERYVDKARRLAGSLSTQTKEAWQNSTGHDESAKQLGCGHIFLLSYPRSGTTLLEKVLSSHSDILTLEEVDCLSDISDEWLANDSGINALARLTPQQAATYRERYWLRVQEATNKNLNGKLLIDKLPLHTLSLPVISKLFPRAKVLFALRDPRDVVLSCFRRRFQINPAMFELLDLQGAALFYNEVMNMAEISRNLLPIQVHEVRHEHLVKSFEPTIKTVLEFIGAQWSPTLKEFVEKLPADPRTPSDIQLRRGLNTDGFGQWRRYETQMEPVMSMLEPWVQRFAYK